MKISQTLAEAIARAAISEPYRQVNYFTTQKLSRWLQERELNFPWEVIHQLWAGGILHPIAVIEPALVTAALHQERFVPIELGYPRISYVDLGIDTPIIPLSQVDGELDYELGECLLWHPFQLWIFRQLKVMASLQLNPGFMLSEGDHWADGLQRWQERSQHAALQLATEERYHEFLRVLGLLLAAEPLVHTVINPTFTYSIWDDESADGYFEWQEHYDGKALCAQFGLSLDTLVDWHRQLAFAARSDDPLEHWRPLLRHAARNRRTRLKGRALRAHDLYDQAETVRRYIEQYHDRELPEEDVVGHSPNVGQLRAQRYGVGRLADFNRTAVRRISRDFGVDPQARVVLFAEGKTEIACWKHLAERLHIDLDLAGIELLDLQGVGGLDSNRLRELLDLFQRWEVFVFIAVDADDRGDHTRLLDRYRDQRLIVRDSQLWEPDFEQANFSLSELAAVATQLANTQGVELSITEPDLSRAMKQQELPAGKAIERLWNQGHYYEGKGELWGQALADWTLNHEAPASIAGDDGERPVSEILSLLLRGQSSDYQATFED